MKTADSKSYVYMLCNKKKNVVYVGSTNDLKKRIYCHKKRLIPGFTRKYNVDQLVYFEAYETGEEALAREKQLKGYRRDKKNFLIQQINPTWSDLYKRI